MFLHSRCLPVLLLAATLPLYAADKKHKPDAVPSAPAATNPDQGPWDDPQPTTEKLDLTMYQRIREEGFQHSHIMH